MILSPRPAQHGRDHVRPATPVLQALLSKSILGEFSRYQVVPWPLDRHTRCRRDRPPCLAISFEAMGRRAVRDRATQAATIRNRTGRGTSIRIRKPGNHGGLPLRVAGDGYDQGCVWGRVRQTKPILGQTLRAAAVNATTIGKLARAAATRRPGKAEERPSRTGGSRECQTKPIWPGWGREILNPTL